MKAWQFTAPHTPLELIEKDDPVAGPAHVVVDVKAAGICHSDVGFLAGELDWMLAFTPIVLGHEVAGIITQLGPGVTEWSIGDRVGIAGLGLDAPGLTTDGGFGTKVLGKVEQLVRIPDGVSYEQAAAGTDAGQTSRHALRTGGVTQGTRLGVIGLGGLGMTGARIGVLLGAEVWAAEPNTELWELADARGVTKVVRDAMELAEFQLDVIIDFAGFGTTTARAIEAVRPGGRVVQVGLGVAEATISVATLVTKQVQLFGSLGGSMEDAQDVFRLLGEGDFEMITTAIQFEDIPAALERLEKGGLRARQIAVYEDQIEGSS